MAGFSLNGAQAGSAALLLLLCLLQVVQLSTALKFDLPAVSQPGKHERCIRNFVSKDQLVVVTAIVDEKGDDSQVVNMHVRFFLSFFLTLLFCFFSRLDIYIYIYIFTINYWIEFVFGD